MDATLPSVTNGQRADAVELQSIGQGDPFALGGPMAIDDPLFDETWFPDVLSTLLPQSLRGPAGGAGSEYNAAPTVHSLESGAPGERWAGGAGSEYHAAPAVHSLESGTTGEHRCWGAVLVGTNERCTPQFDVGKATSKTSFVQTADRLAFRCQRRGCEPSRPRSTPSGPTTCISGSGRRTASTEAERCARGLAPPLLR